MFSQEKFIVFQIVVPPLAVPSFSLATFRSTVLLFSSFANKESVCGYLWVESESKSVSYSVMSDSVTPWTIGHQAPLSVEFSRQEYWGGLPFPSLGDLSDPVIEPGSPALEADSLPSEQPGKEKKGK